MLSRRDCPPPFCLLVSYRALASSFHGFSNHQIEIPSRQEIRPSSSTTMAKLIVALMLLFGGLAHAMGNFGSCSVCEVDDYKAESSVASPDRVASAHAFRVRCLNLLSAGLHHHVASQVFAEADGTKITITGTRDDGGNPIIIPARALRPPGPPKGLDDDSSRAGARYGSRYHGELPGLRPNLRARAASIAPARPPPARRNPNAGQCRGVHLQVLRRGRDGALWCQPALRRAVRALQTRKHAPPACCEARKVYIGI